MTWERISFTLDQRDKLLSFQMGFSFIRAAVACSILVRVFGLEPSSETTAPRYLKLVTVPSFRPCTFISLWMPMALFVISLVFSALISILYLVQVLSRLSFTASTACSQLEHLYHRQTADQNISAAFAELPIMFFQSFRHDPFEKIVEEGG